MIFFFFLCFLCLNLYPCAIKSDLLLFFFFFLCLNLYPCVIKYYLLLLLLHLNYFHITDIRRILQFSRQQRISASYTKTTTTEQTKNKTHTHTKLYKNKNKHTFICSRNNRITFVCVSIHTIICTWSLSHTRGTTCTHILTESHTLSVVYSHGDTHRTYGIDTFAYLLSHLS